MLVSMLDDKSYVIGDKIIKVGDEVDLTTVPSVCLNGFAGTFEMADLNGRLLAMAKTIRDLRARICGRLHETEGHYDEELARSALEYENTQRDWLFLMDVMFKGIQNHLGAPIPLHRDTKTGKITIRKKEANEPMNYVRDSVANLVRFNTYLPLRELLLTVIGAHEIAIESDLHLDSEMPCLSTRSTGIAAAKALLTESLKKGVAHLNYGIPIVLLWATNERTYVFDARAAIPRGQPQGNELIALNLAIQRAAKILPKPEVVGTLAMTKLDFVQKDLPGILVSVFNGVGEHTAFKFDDKGETFDIVSEGAETKLHQHINSQIAALFKKE